MLMACFIYHWLQNKEKNSTILGPPNLDMGIKACDWGLKIWSHSSSKSHTFRFGSSFCRCITVLIFYSLTGFVNFAVRELVKWLHHEILYYKLLMLVLRLDFIRQVLHLLCKLWAFYWILTIYCNSLQPSSTPTHTSHHQLQNGGGYTSQNNKILQRGAAEVSIFWTKD